MYCLASFEKKLYLPFAFNPVCAGFPSPATDYMDKKIDLNEFIVKHPAATFYVRAEGNSMLGAGIHSGDLLVVDRSLKAVNGSIIVAIVDGEFTVKRLCLRNNSIVLQAENDLYKSIVISENMDFEIWGVVTTVIHSV
ncbi:LexA family protein [Fluviispira vulneris]|uniref:LexA family protein n=1 Tax=Fluviispira vulneris TaxID=2763012 RepID=UPI00164851B2|nr:translesion error-prone DNA polymerase V autoproteolytic subunit [Fluviispira vulneris]